MTKSPGVSLLLVVLVVATIGAVMLSGNNVVTGLPVHTMNDAMSFGIKMSPYAEWAGFQAGSTTQPVTKSSEGIGASYDTEDPTYKPPSHEAFESPLPKSDADIMPAYVGQEFAGVSI